MRPGMEGGKLFTCLFYVTQMSFEVGGFTGPVNCLSGPMKAKPVFLRIFLLACCLSSFAGGASGLSSSSFRVFQWTFCAAGVYFTVTQPERIFSV